MAQVAPLRLRLVRPEWTDRVPSPAHDALTPAQRMSHLREHPESYLAVTRGPEDFDGNKPLSALELVGEGKRALDKLLNAGVFGSIGPDGYYAYRLESDGWCQTGIVGGVHMDDYDAGIIRVHEQIHDDRARHLALHAEIVGAQSSPVAVAHHPNREIAAILESIEVLEPELHFTLPDGLIQTVWAIPAEYTSKIRNELADERLYLIDGHHRTAAAKMRYEKGGAPWMLAALFSTDQLQNRAFHRFVHPTVQDPLAALRTLDGTVEGRVGDGKGHIQLYYKGYWLTVPHRSPKRPLERLDMWQFEALIRPVLGRDASVAYLSSSGDEDQLLESVDRSGELLALMTAVTMPQLFAVADAGDVMPPKSTYFEPKVRSGIFLRHL